MTKKSNKSKKKRKGATVTCQPPIHLAARTVDDSSRVCAASTSHPSPSTTKSSGLNDEQEHSVGVIDRVLRLLQGRRNVVVLVGAGISTSCGIPDFRSPDCGLYTSLDLEALGLNEPEDLFDLEFFVDNPVPFYKFAKHLYFPPTQEQQEQNSATTTTTTTTTSDHTSKSSTTIQPSDSHKLLALLEKNKMLLRVYTQNIDGLEGVAGVSPSKTVHVHGSLTQSRCLKCKKRISSDTIMDDIERGCVARCRQPVKTKKRMNPKTKHNKGNIPDDDAATASPSSSSSSSEAVEASTIPPPRPPSERIRHRAISLSSTSSTSSSFSQKSESYGQMVVDGTMCCGGILKPDITFFGETLDEKCTRLLEMDRHKADALLVIGTSLQVAPISHVIHYLPSNIPRILINRTIVHPPSPPPSIGQQASNEDDAAATTLVEDVDAAAGTTTDFRKDQKYVFDAYLLGFCDDISRVLAKRLFQQQQGVENALVNTLSQSTSVSADADSSSITNTANSKSKKRKRRGTKNKIPPETSTLSTATPLSQEYKRYTSIRLLSDVLVDQRDREGHGKYDGSVSSTSSSSSTFDHDEWTRQDWSNVSVPPDRVVLFAGAQSSSSLLSSSSNNSPHGDAAVVYKEVVCCDGCSRQVSDGHNVFKCNVCFDFDLCEDCYPKVSKKHCDGKHSFTKQ